jgi:hypothetical protein
MKDRFPADIPAAAVVPAREPARGQALPQPQQGLLGARFGMDFSRVSIHDDAAAAGLAAAHRAQAVTQGENVMFARGRYAPATAAGQNLLAHELAHVVQQSQGERVAHAADPEARADAAAAQVTHGGHVSPHALGGAPHGPQAKPDDGPPIPSPVIPIAQSLAAVELEAGETIGKTNPKLVQIAESYKAGSGLGGAARVQLSADLTADAKNSSARESAERSTLGGRMREARDALVALGVPSDAIDISPATAYSTSAHGQVAAAVSKRAAMPPLTPPMTLPPQGVVPPANVPPAPAASVLSLDLDFTFGPVTVSLPKEVRAKLPIALAGAKKLVIDLGFEVPAKFSFKITLDGTPHLRVSLKAGAEVDPKNTSATASAGLQIETTSTICNAPDPGETREKIKTAGDKLNKAAKEFESATGSDKLGKAFDIAAAIGEMYDAVDKAKARCKQVPRATVELGYKRLLTPGSETDPTKLPPTDYVGITGTFHF